MSQENSDSTCEPSPTTGRSWSRMVVRLIWPVCYFVSVAGIIWWYESGSGFLFSQRIQGVWREIQGEGHTEKFTDNRLFIEDAETWRLFPQEEKWDVRRSRITVKPAKGFYQVRREFAFDWGKNTLSSEYILYHRGDQLFALYGLARLDSAQQRSIRKYRRSEQLPPGAADAIEAYLDRFEQD